MSKQNYPTEHIEQANFVYWFKNQYPNVRIMAIPNGGKRAISTASRLKLEGVSPGVPDLFIPAVNLWIEMKRVKGGTVSAVQKDWMKYLTEECGHTVIIARGFEDAKEQLYKKFN